MTENVNHPAHYGGADNPYEVIKVAEAWGFDKNAYLFNVLKYIARPGKGRTLEDLKKARWYLNRLIDRLEGVQEMQADAEEKLTDHQKFVKEAIIRLESKKQPLHVEDPNEQCGRGCPVYENTAEPYQFPQSPDINTNEAWRTGYNKWSDRSDF